MDTKEIQEIIKLMEENNLVEVEIEQEGKKIKLRKAEFRNLAPQDVIYKQTATPSQPAQEEQKTPAKSENLIEIKSPMVGTFYRASAPNAEPYVEVGKKIKKGDVLCIIEAMKLMNEIKSEVDGEIVEILVENGEPIEYGQPLFLVK